MSKLMEEGPSYKVRGVEGLVSFSRDGNCVEKKSATASLCTEILGGFREKNVSVVSKAREKPDKE